MYPLRELKDFTAAHLNHEYYSAIFVNVSDNLRLFFF